MLEFLAEIVILIIWDLIILRIVRAIIWIGAFVCSMFSGFKVPIHHHYKTTDFDEKVKLFWIGFLWIVSLGLFVFSVTKV